MYVKTDIGKFFLMMLIIALLMLCFFTACATKTWKESNLQSALDFVKNCMTVQQDVPVHIPKPTPGSKWVVCNGVQRRDCYSHGVLYLPELTTENNIKHGFVHAVCDKVFGLGDDPQHLCRDEQGNSYYLKCSGIQYDD